MQTDTKSFICHEQFLKSPLHPFVQLTSFVSAFISITKNCPQIEYYKSLAQTVLQIR